MSLAQRRWVGVVVAVACLPVVAPAAFKIRYTYTSQITVRPTQTPLGPPDPAGLNGATAVVQYISTGLTYGARQGEPALAAPTATLTITGSSVPGNNGVYVLPPLAYFPHTGGSLADTTPAATNIDVPIGTGGPLTLRVYGAVTPSGAAATPEGEAQVGDFSLVAPVAVAWTTPTSGYSLVTTILVELIDERSAPPIAPLPAPPTLALFGLVGMGLAAVRRWRTGSVV
jgi:hypothetical protein